MASLRMSRSGSATSRLSGSRASGPRAANAFNAARRTLGSALFTSAASRANRRRLLVPGGQATAGAITTTTSAADEEPPPAAGRDRSGLRDASADQKRHVRNALMGSETRLPVSLIPSRPVPTRMGAGLSFG